MTRTPQGFDLSIMKDAMRGEVKKMGSDGSLAKAFGATPPKKRR